LYVFIQQLANIIILCPRRRLALDAACNSNFSPWEKTFCLSSQHRKTYLLS